MNMFFHQKSGQHFLVFRQLCNIFNKDKYSTHFEICYVLVICNILMIYNTLIVP